MSFFQHIVVILHLRTTIFLMLAISLTLSVPHMIDSQWLAILMVNILRKLLFDFLEKHNAANIVKHKVCFKRLDKSSCIDLFITSRPHCFQNKTVFSTGLSHFHKMVVTVLKASFSKAPPKEMLHRGYKFLSKINSNMN